MAEAIAGVEALDVSCSREYTVASWLPCWYDLITAERYRLIMDTYTIPCIGVIKLMKLTSHDLQQLYIATSLHPVFRFSSILGIYTISVKASG